MNNNVYKGSVQPNPKEYSVWVDSKGVIKTWNGTEWIEQSGTSNNGGNSGGGLLLHFLPTEDFTGDYLQNCTEQDLLVYEEYVKHNKEVYNTLLDCNTNHKPVPGPIYFDSTFFEWNFNKREDSVRGGIVAFWRTVGSGEEMAFYLHSMANGSNDNLYLLPNGLIQFE